jgi:hypothetical protein
MPDVINLIKEVAVSSMFSDDTLKNIFVLKGGNALNLVYNVISRASLDIDLSMQTTLDDFDIQEVKDRIEKALIKGFRDEGYTIFDYSFNERPQKVLPGVPPFWGGYLIEFKIIEKENYNAQDILASRKKSITLASDQQRIFSIDISKYEYCDTKIKRDLHGYVIYTYTPEMILFEKLRAICQQTEEYQAIFGKSHKSQRARDFFDIYCILEYIKIDLADLSNYKLIRNIFKAKQVPLDLLFVMQKYRELHLAGYDSLRNTVNIKDDLKDFEYYFDYVLDFISKLKSLGIV